MCNIFSEMKSPNMNVMPIKISAHNITMTSPVEYVC